MSQFDHKAPAFLAGLVPLNPGEVIAYWTGKTLNALSGSRTAVNANIVVGAIVAYDRDKHDLQSIASQYTKANDIVIVGQPTTGYLTGGRGVVKQIVSSDINEIPDSAAPNQRRGGYVIIQVGPGEVDALIPNSTSVGAALAVGNIADTAIGSLIASPGIADITAILQHAAVCQVANSSGAVALRRVFWKG